MTARGTTGARVAMHVAPEAETVEALRLAGLTNIALQPNGCWHWTGYLSASGYGQMGRCLAPHRRAFELVNGPIPDGLTIDHACHTNDDTCPGGVTCLHRRCLNPRHLELVTPGENVMRGRGFAPAKASQETCIAGHAFTSENTRIRRNGTRNCKECARRRCRESYRRAVQRGTA